MTDTTPPPTFDAVRDWLDVYDAIPDGWEPPAERKTIGAFQFGMFVRYTAARHNITEQAATELVDAYFEIG